MENSTLYLVAHAPAEPWDSFEANLSALGKAPSSPNPSDPIWDYTPDQQDQIRAWQRGDAPIPKWASDYESAYARYIEARDAHRVKSDVLRRSQWPWWWAKQILDAAPKD
jgi:hypothetical protein